MPTGADVVPDVVVELVLVVPAGVVDELAGGLPVLLVAEELPVPAVVLVTAAPVLVAAALVVLVVLVELELPEPVLLELELLGMFGYGGVWQHAL